MAETPLAIFFAGPQDFADWLATHHDSATELWMGLNKKHVPNRGLTWEDAVVEALCWGWIDSRSERIDDDAVRQRWTPRKTTSTWSRINIATAERLIAQGRMQPSGLAAFEARREDRSGIYSFEQPAEELTPDEDAQLRQNPAATAFWEASTPGYRRTCVHWVHSAKQQRTRERRLAQLIDDCAQGRLIPSQRYGTPPTWVGRAAAAAAAATTPTEPTP